MKKVVLLIGAFIVCNSTNSYACASQQESSKKQAYDTIRAAVVSIKPVFLLSQNRTSWKAVIQQKPIYKCITPLDPTQFDLDNTGFDQQTVTPKNYASTYIHEDDKTVYKVFHKK